MASNQLSTATRHWLETKLDSLFGRVLTGFTCPLTYSERITLCRCNLSTEEVKSIEAVEALGVLRRDYRMIVRIDKPSGAGELQLRMHAHDASINISTALVGVANRGIPPDRGLIASRLGREAAGRFFRWFDEAVQLSEDINLALTIHNDIMGMARTAGHLRRMAPELYRLSGCNPDLTLRSSAVPYEWSAYSRRNGDHLASTLAKCLLLPDVDDQIRWSMRNNYTWPIVGEED